MRKLGKVRFCTLLLPVVACAFGGATALAQKSTPLQVMGNDYPRAYFFRSCEGMAASGQVPYEQWQQCFSRLMGIEGKVLDEEVPGRAMHNLDFFTRFKRDHPDQLVLLHYNGNARDPRYQIEPYFAGHWLYYAGTTILADLPAETGETDIQVDNPLLFRTEIGRFRNGNDDIGLCMLDDAGKPDWRRCEQVQLVSVDIARKVIRVRRGCYGTTPRALPAGRAYAAAHMTEGPWGRRSHLMWYYNYSTRCPRDENGRTCGDIHATELAARFSPKGELATFDGLEFDVLHHRVGGSRQGRGADCDADGQVDMGIFDGINTYGIGVVEFCRKLRSEVGEETILQADGAGSHNQRAFGLLNGIESEGWPHLSDWEIRDWSGGLNRHFFWRDNARPPVFNYVNHKFTAAGALPGQRIQPPVPFAIHRLVMAAATFTDSALCYATAPQKQPGELYGIWDELRMGTENRLGWLGRPLGPAVRLARRQPEVLNGRVDTVAPRWLDRIGGDGLAMDIDKGRLSVTATDPSKRELRFRMSDVPCDGPDLFVSITARGHPMRGYPREVARLMSVGIARSETALLRSEPPSTGMRCRGEEEAALDTQTGASVRWAKAVTLGDQTHDAYLVHPPYRGKTGYVFWQRDVAVPDDGRLTFFTGMGEKSPGRSDGVTFRVLVADVPVFEQTQVASRWIPHDVSLADYAGQRVRLRFVADCGPRDNATTDHAHWGDVLVVDPNRDTQRTAPVSYMSWLGTREFTSGFYFSAIRSKTVDLEFVVEGIEPVELSAIGVHHHPDAMFREFEHGLVLANPSPRPYTFDLSRLSPGRRFRHLQGSSKQDPEVNDGSPVDGRVTLGPKEGLFLVAIPEEK